MAAETKIEPVRDRTPSSIESSQSPEPELGGEPSQESTQPLKRKGGRKPVCQLLYQTFVCLFLY